MAEWICKEMQMIRQGDGAAIGVCLAREKELVRCKDCIHWYEPDGVCLKIYSDGAVSPYAWQYRNEDDFCSYGERKDNET